MPISLLNVDQPISMETIEQDLADIIREIHELLDTLEQEKHASSSKLVVLRNRVKTLQNIVSALGNSEEIKIETKSNIIRNLQNELLLLSNRLTGIDEYIDNAILTNVNFLLYHLTSTAASTPQSQVIGVSNILAQVLTNDLAVTEPPSLKTTSSDPGFFSEFSNYYNYLVTSAGLFAAPVIGLPGISTTDLGNWADQALKQLAIVHKFILSYFDPALFYEIETKYYVNEAFDLTSDILSQFLFENEFFISLATRADLLSGLELPADLSATQQAVPFQSVDDITITLCDAIIHNVETIEHYIQKTKKSFNEGKINRNDNPDTNPNLQKILLEAKAWRVIATLGKLLTQILNNENTTVTVQPTNINPKNELPSLSKHTTDHERSLYYLLDELMSILSQIQQGSKNTPQEFIQSSLFTKYKEYLHYVLIIVAIHDLYLQRSPWLPWFMEKFESFFRPQAIPYNPLNTLELSFFLIFTGLIQTEKTLVYHGIELLNNVKPFFLYQTHHLVAADILSLLVKIWEADPSFQDSLMGIQEYMYTLIEKYEIQPQTLLFQRINLYLGMLQLFAELGVFIRKQNERLVPFDVFSWLQIPSNTTILFPYIPLNTALDNLSSM